MKRANAGMITDKYCMLDSNLGSAHARVADHIYPVNVASNLTLQRLRPHVNGEGNCQIWGDHSDGNTPLTRDVVD